MIVQHIFTLNCPISRSLCGHDLAYRFYSDLLSRTDSVYAGRLHENSATPVRHYLRPEDDDASVRWCVTLFGEEASAMLSPLLGCRQEFTYNRMGERYAFPVTGHSVRILHGVSDFRKTVGDGEVRIRFCTPTAFRSRGTYVCFPTTRLIVQSLLRKWNTWMGDELLLDEDETDILADGLPCVRFRLHRTGFRLKRQEIPGFVGEMTFGNVLEGEAREHASLLLHFAEYAGVGIKTALGMGGTEVGDG